MLSKHKYICCCIVLLCSFTSCMAPVKPVPLLSPKSPTSWWYGKAVSTSEKDDVWVDVMFVRSTHNELILEINIQNSSDRAISFNPKYFFIQKGKARKGQIKWSSTRTSPNPEQNRNNNQEVEEVIDKTPSFYDVIDIQNRAKVDSNDTVIQKSLDNERFFWEFNRLKMTTLPSGYNVRGKVHYPRQSKTRDLLLSLRIDGKWFEFQFNRRLIKVPVEE